MSLQKLVLAGSIPFLLILLRALAVFLLDGNINQPLPSFLEEALGIRPRGDLRVQREASFYTKTQKGSPDSYHDRTPRAPVMGWSSWNTFQCDVNESLVLQTARSLLSSGLAAKGYNYVNIDDCWQAMERDENDDLVADPVKFPRGIKPLADDVHSMGLKLGLYTDYGVKTCAGYPGSYGFYARDARSFSDWGVDFVKVDRCAPTIDQDRYPAKYFRHFGAALDAAYADKGTSIVYSICNWGREDEAEGPPWQWAPGVADMWRTTADVWPRWHRVRSIIDLQKDLGNLERRGGHNDPDMLEVGVKGKYLNVPFFPSSSLNAMESLTHFVMWSMLSSPLIIGADLRNPEDWVVDILGNSGIIEINQDILSDQAVLVEEHVSGGITKSIDLGEYWGNTTICYGVGCEKKEVWIKNIVGGVAVAFYNKCMCFYRVGSINLGYVFHIQHSPVLLNG